MKILITLTCTIGILSTAPSVYSQTTRCDATVVRLYPRALQADLQEAAKIETLQVSNSQGRFPTTWDSPSGSFVVNLQGTHISTAQLGTLQPNLAGFRFTIDPSSSRMEQTAQACIGHISVNVSRVWRVNVSVPSSNDQIQVTYRLNSQIGPTLQTPAEIPRGQNGDVLDWATTLELTIFPLPNDRDSSYKFDLRTTHFSKPQCGLTVPGHYCQDKQEILNLLATSRRRWSGFTDQLVMKRKVVDRIEFELERP